MPARFPLLALSLFLILTIACTGAIDGRTPGDPPPPGSQPVRPPPADPVLPPAAGPPAAPPAPDAILFGRTGLRRLTQSELRATLQDLTGVDPGTDIDLLPADDRTPFDNDYTTQVASRALVEAAATIARGLAAKIVADAAARARLVGCTPTGPANGTCFRQFVTNFGRRALRRPLQAAEIERLMALQAFSSKRADFYVGVGLVVRALLQDLEFLYLTAVGTPVEGSADLVKLSEHEVASRLSYLFWGSLPDEALFDAAAKGTLSTTDGVRTQALRLLQHPRGRSRVSRFHALWLGYEQPNVPADLRAPMLAESDALVDRVIFGEPGSWKRLFTTAETYVDKRLAAHYGLAAPAKGTGWVAYPPASQRQGILSHGGFLSNGNKGGDTSPTMRGLHIRKALFCQDIPPPPPDLNVNTDEPPKPMNGVVCKKDRYAQHGTGGCAGCHQQIDPVGFGLEAFDGQGRFRTVEAENSSCPIDGAGELVGVGKFRGPKELGLLVAMNTDLERCLATQVYRFTLGRRERPEDADAIRSLATVFRNGGHRFDGLLVEMVGSPAFAYRTVE